MHGEARRLRDQLARVEEGEERNAYIRRLTSNPAQDAVFARALKDNNVDVYLDDVIGECQRTTLPRTWQDDNPYTRH
ncbi:hypothetical protein BC941DRAFT_424482 [Chlamydoabsidia padenii]|nr:hypothetical protein BC941DRAFT_424482 [Chlamydoabsidia padenii]